MHDELVEAWKTNNRISLFLLGRVGASGLKCTLSKRGGRDVALQFAHIHNVRVWHLEKRAKDLAKGLAPFESKVSPKKTELKKALTASGRRIETFLGDVLAGKPKRRGFKKGVFTTLSYLVAHESHHRGSILLTLKECGHGLDNDSAYRIWGWDQM